MQWVDFWNDQVVATRTSQKVAELKEEIERLHGLQKELVDLEELQKMAPDHDFSEDLKKIQGDIDKEEFRLFLGGKYDKKNALLEIFSGAGGQDAQDWVAMLLRMYEKYCAKKGFRMAVLHQSFGDGGGPDGRIGVKSVTLEIKGKYAYGLLRREAGVHRLVRISPFSSQKLRHTSFALVDVLPEIDEDESQVEIKPNELRIDTFKSSGPGGQYVNKTESAVRITHLPTGLVVASQSERLQGKNKDNAMKILLAKLHQLKKDEHQKKLKEIKGEAISVSWGNQIRSYVLHPYKMVKDLRTQYETSQAEEVLDGELDQFINEEIKLGS
jgi:peptide chain release factor 2